MKKKIMYVIGGCACLLSMAAFLGLAALTGYDAIDIRVALPWGIVAVLIAINGAKVAIRNE